MDSTMTSGPVIAVLGIGAVFVALSILIATITLVGRILRRPSDSFGEPSAGRSVASTTSAPTGAAAERGDGDALLLVALAAYGMHRRRRVSVRGPSPSSAWAGEGRSRQVLRAETTRLSLIHISEPTRPY